MATPNGLTDPSNAALYAKYVRKALNYMIPRGAFIEEAMGGYGDLGVTFVSPLTSGYSPAVFQYTYNETAAREFMERAGYIWGYPPGPFFPDVGFILLLGAVLVIQVIILAVLLLQYHNRRVHK